MTSLWIAFITGLTTGGLSCMMVQGGLLASSLANQIEKDMVSDINKSGKRSIKIALPIALFLLAKLVMYTALGTLLGAAGQILQLTPATQAILQFAVAFFMIGNALRMLNVHPIFRFFTFEPPASLTRFIRRKAKSNSRWFTPIFLGGLTVIIPCGVTQTIMAAAVATSDPLTGALLMFAFTLGTSPIFFLLSYFATRLGALLEKKILRFAAILLIVLSLLSIDSGLNLLGSRVSITRLTGNLFNAESAISSVESGREGIVNTTLVLNVVEKGYRPRTLHAPADVPVKLQLVTEEVYSCSRAFLIPGIDYGVILYATGIEEVEIPPQPKGSVLPFTCSMGMYTGKIVFDL